MPSGVSPNLLIMRSESDPWLVPIRMAVPYSLQILTSGENLSRMRCSSPAYCASVYSMIWNFFLSA